MRTKITTEKKHAVLTILPAVLIFGYAFAADGLVAAAGFRAAIIVGIIVLAAAAAIEACDEW